jgi:hypothetical protein
MTSIKLLTIPTDPKNVVLWGYSSSRLLLVVLNLLVVCLFIAAGIWIIRKRTTIQNWFAQRNNPGFWVVQFLITLIALIVLLLAINIPLKYLHLEVYISLRERLKPDLIWFSWIAFFALLTTIFGYWYGITYEAETSRRDKIQKPELVWVRIAYVFLAALFILSQLISLRSFPTPVIGGDSDDYLYLAEKSIFNREFYAGPRPWTTGLLYKILNLDKSLAAFAGQDGIIKGHPFTRPVLVQTLIHSISWLTLAYFTAAWMRKEWVRPVTFCIVLMIGLSPAVYRWNSLLLSESLSISLMVLTLALWFWLLMKWQWHIVLLLFAATFFWVFTRESNAVLILILGIVLLPIGLIKKSQRPLLFFGITLVLIYLLSSTLSDMRNRWVTPLANVIFQRTLSDQRSLDFFIAHGMPAGPVVLSMTGKWACVDDCALFHEEKYQPFREWLFSEGRTVYIRYLLAYLDWSLLAPLINLKDLIGNHLRLPGWPGYISPIPVALSSILFLQGYAHLLLLGTLILAALVLGFRIWKTQPAVIVVLIFLVLAYPHAFIVFHGDAVDTGRHAIQFSIQMRLCFWLLALYVLDWLIKNPIHSLHDFKL